MQGRSGSFSIESIAFAPRFEGIEAGSSALRVSSDFSQVIDGAVQRLTIKKPFEGMSEEGTGVLLEYGGAEPGSVLSLKAKAADGNSREFAIRTHPRGTRTCLDRALLGLEPESLTLIAPKGLAIKAFYAAELGSDDYGLADLGRILLEPTMPGVYALYRWDMLPAVLVFDFKDYGVQDRYLKRLAFFTEKSGFRGTLVGDGELVGRHGWNAHDYGPDELAAFFRAAKAKNFPLSPEERELEGILELHGIVDESGGTIAAGTGAIISISWESSAALRWTFAVHESTHAIFFSDPEYRKFARGLWSSLDAKEKWFWKTYLGWAGYDSGDDFLMGNEFQAYLLQQPAYAAEDYFEKRKGAELLEKHPELSRRVDDYMAAYGDRFAQRARTLEAWLGARYGIEAGRTICLSER
jgi:hypothetical protein